MSLDIILEEDVTAAAKAFYTEELKGKTVFITGATGLIGSQLAKALLKCNDLFDANLTVVAFIRNEEKAKAVFEGYLDEHLVLLKGDLLSPITYDGSVDYIFHGASVTGSKDFVQKPVETIHTAITGTEMVLQFAAQKQVSGMVYLSSLEAYGTPDGKNETIKENDYGYIEPLSVRSSYSEGKRMVECLCASHASEYGVPVKIARLSQTFGAGVDYNDGRVFAEFARCAIEHKDIILHTDGSTVRTYCYTEDALTALLTILLKGKVAEAYNVTNKETACSIKEMADLVAGLYPEAGVQVRIEIPENLASFGYNPQMVIRLNTEKLEALGWNAHVGMEEMFRRTIESMKGKK